MTIGQLKCFVAVANEQSFAKAANKLFVSQPAISRSIAKLEEEVGVPLLDRKASSLPLTVTGRRLYDLFTRAEQEYGSILDEIRQLRENAGKTIRLGCPDTWDPNVFFDRLIEHFQRFYPSVHLEIQAERLPDLMGMLQSGKLDLLLTFEDQRAVQNGFLIRPVTETGSGVMFSRKYFPNIHSLSDLDGLNLLVFDVDADNKFGKAVKKVCLENGFRPIIKNCTRYGSALFQMACGQGVMLYSEWDNTLRGPDYDMIQFPFRPMVNLVYPSPEERPELKFFTEELVSLFA